MDLSNNRVEQIQTSLFELRPAIYRVLQSTELEEEI